MPYEWVSERQKRLKPFTHLAVVVLCALKSAFCKAHLHGSAE